jgi:hypothetical protein
VLVILDKAIPGGSELVLAYLGCAVPAIPTVLTTASFHAQSAYDAFPFVALFVKPFDITALLDTIAQYVLPGDRWREVG